MNSSKKFAFIDRDGTILEEPADKQIDSVEKFSFKFGVIDFLKRLKEKHYDLILVTNQDGLGTSSYPSKIYEDLNTLMIRTLESVGVSFTEIYVCPHFESEICLCRKPALGLLPNYIVNRDYDVEKSFVVGDRETDLIFAKNLGVKGFDCNKLSWTQILKVIDCSMISRLERVTSETAIFLELFKGTEKNEISTSVPFLDHMLDSLFRFSGFQIKLNAKGDTFIDDHHLIEDIAICIGQAFKNATLEKRGITRFSQWTPMDESLSLIILDLCNRPSFEFKGDFGRGFVGGVNTEMIPHFFKILALTMAFSLHIEFKGLNTHHQCEAIFKGFGICLRRALRPTGEYRFPSTKGIL